MVSGNLSGRPPPETHLLKTHLGSSRSKPKNYLQTVCTWMRDVHDHWRHLPNRESLGKWALGRKERRSLTKTWRAKGYRQTNSQRTIWRESTRAHNHTRSKQGPASAAVSHQGGPSRTGVKRAQRMQARPPISRVLNAKDGYSFFSSSHQWYQPLLITFIIFCAVAEMGFFQSFNLLLI